MKATLYLLAAMVMCCVAGNVLAEVYPSSVDPTEITGSEMNFIDNLKDFHKSFNDNYFKLSWVQTQMGGPTCTEPPDITVPAWDEGTCFTAAQLNCGFRVASVCFYEGSECNGIGCCSFTCMGNH